MLVRSFACGVPAHLLCFNQVAESRIEELAPVKEDLELKLLLWNSRAELAQLVAGWKGCRFDALDVSAMEELVAR